MPHQLDETWRLLEDFADAARLLHAGDGQADVLPALCELAVTMTGADHASVATVRGGRLRAVSATSDLPATADLLQLDTAQGPCVEAGREAATSRVGDLATDPRWPALGRRVVQELGLRSLLAHVLPVDGHSVGAVTVYAARPDAFTPEHESVLSILGAVASATLRADRQEGRADALERALRASRRIGMAVGVLMATRRVTADDAWELLTAESMNRNIKVSSLAEHVIATGTFETPPRS